MKKIQIKQFDDPELIAAYFKSRLDWMPEYYSTQSWFVNWAEGLKNDKAKYKHNTHGERYISADNVVFEKDSLTLKTMPVHPVQMDGYKFYFRSGCLVGLDSYNKFRMRIEAEFSCNPNAVDAIWFLSDNPNGDILPELDSFETNTPGCSNQLSQSLLIGDSYPARIKWAHKYPLVVARGIRSYNARRTNWFDITTSPVFSVHFRTKHPIYPVIWNTAGRHQHLTQEAQLKIYNIYIEYE